MESLSFLKKNLNYIGSLSIECFPLDFEMQEGETGVNRKIKLSWVHLGRVLTHTCCMAPVAAAMLVAVALFPVPAKARPAPENLLRKEGSYLLY